MKKLILLLVLFIASISYSQTITSTQKGYFKAVVGDSVLVNRTTERKAKDDGFIYALKHGYEGYRILFPDYVQVYLEGFQKDSIVVVEPPIETPTDTIITPPPVIVVPPITTGDGDVYVFKAEEWGIVQGLVSDEVSATNRVILNQAIETAKEAGFTVFEIDNIDAFFNVSSTHYQHDYNVSIRIPSNFHLNMGDNCNLRVQPNGNIRYALLYSYNTENVIITGGKLWGDRYAHNYEINSTHEWGYLIMFKGVHNGVVDNVEQRKATGDGFYVKGIGSRNDGYVTASGRESYNITIKNCLIDDNRRNNISIVDGTDIFIEYNTITNAGSGTADLLPISSNGISPRANIQIEPYKKNAPDNNSVNSYQKVENIYIHHNVCSGAISADINLFNGEKAYVYNNEFYSLRGLGTTYGYNNKIYNNTFENKSTSAYSGTGIGVAGRKWANGEERIKDWEIYGNTFKNYRFAIVIGGENHQVYDNIMNECKVGIKMNYNLDCFYSNNKITSNISGSAGYSSATEESQIKNTIIKNSTVATDGSELHFLNVNNTKSGNLIIDNVTVEVIKIKQANGVTIKNSTFDKLTNPENNVIEINNN